MKRREFIRLFGGAAVSWPLVARGQEAGRTYRLGFLVPTARQSAPVIAMFDELRINGFIEGQNLIVMGGFDIRPPQINEAAAALVKAAPDVIACGPELYARALKTRTNAIPIAAITEDLVGEGFAASLARPGGNVTGMSLLSPELDSKRLGLLIEAVPGAKRMAALADRTLTPRHIEQLQDAARQRSVELAIVTASKPEEIALALDEAKVRGAEAINVLASPLFFFNPRPTIDHMISLRIPAVYQWPEQAEAGGLIGYGPRLTEIYRQRSRMLVKMLRGAKGEEVPVEQPTKFELVINLKTAKTIGYEVPAALVLRTDKLIE